jgi:hypothetical protein
LEIAKKIHKEALLLFENFKIIEVDELKTIFGIVKSKYCNLPATLAKQMCQDWSHSLRSLGSELCRPPSDVIDLTQHELQRNKTFVENDKKERKLAAGKEVIKKSLLCGNKKNNTLDTTSIKGCLN